MKGLVAWIVGVGLTGMSVGAPAVIADENGAVHYWNSSSTYVPSDERVGYERSEEAFEPSGRMVSVMPMVAPGTRVYFVNDDPAYDLSGANDHWFLVGDGTAFHENSWRSPAAFASMGPTPHEVVPISAEYRQDWLAVAAGDRPVRTFTAPRSTMDAGAMAAVPSGVVYTSSTMRDNDENRYTRARNTDTFRPVHHPRHRTYVHHRMHSAQLSAAWRHNRYRRHRAVSSNYSYSSTEREDEPVMKAAVSEPAFATTEMAVEVRHDAMGHELFQINNSWYMKENGDWLRSESWRGPFVHVHKGSVPREVRMSAKHESRMDRD